MEVDTESQSLTSASVEQEKFDWDGGWEESPDEAQASEREGSGYQVCYPAHVTLAH